MILKDNYSEQHIRDLQTASKGDPGLIERTLYAFGLLEALVEVQKLISLDKDGLL